MLVIIQGRLEALSVNRPSLPADYGLPILIVVHVPPDTRGLLAELFQARCSIKVREVEDKEPISGKINGCHRGRHPPARP